MPKWTVHKVVTDWGEGWEVRNPIGAQRGFFPTWAKAVAYADQCTHITTVRLPPLHRTGVQKIGGSGLESLWVDHERPLTRIYYGGWGDLGIETQYLKPLALYLLAVARKKGV